jgi:hypothetical protein
VRTHPFDVKLMVIVRLSSGSYRVRLMIDKATGPFDSASEDVVILSGATLFSVLLEDDRQKRCTHTSETC